MRRARPPLRTLTIEVTQQCNHACLFCYNVWHPDGSGRPSGYPLGEMDTAATLALLAKVLDETGCRAVTLTGGEPLMRADLPEIVELLRQRDATVTIGSNGHLLTTAAIAGLLARGVCLFELPLLSHRQEVHDELSDVSGAFDAVLAAMAQLRRHRGQFIAVFVATRRNLADLRPTIELAYAFGARGIMLNRFNPGGRGRAHMAELLPDVAAMREGLMAANDAVRDLGVPISCAIPIQPCLIDLAAYPHVGFGFCAAGTERAYYTLDPLGNLRPCNHSPVVLGDLRASTFADAVAGDRMLRFAEAAPVACARCELVGSCRGGCKASAQVCYGSEAAEEPFLRHNPVAAPVGM